MNITLQDIKTTVAQTTKEHSDTERRLKELAKRLEEEMAVLAYLERIDRTTSQDTGSSEISSKAALSPTGTINLDDLDLPKKAERKSTLLDDIRDVILRFASQEFTINHVHAALLQMGKGNDAKHYKNRVSINIKKLLEDRFITRTFTGSGNNPHRYKLSQSTSNDVQAQEG